MHVQEDRTGPVVLVLKLPGASCIVRGATAAYQEGSPPRTPKGVPPGCEDRSFRAMDTDDLPRRRRRAVQIASDDEEDEMVEESMDPRACMSPGNATVARNSVQKRAWIPLCAV